MSLWSLLPSVANFAVTAINKPKEIKMNDKYLKSFTANLRADKLSGDVRQKALEAESKIIGKKTGRAMRTIQAQEADPAQKQQAIVDLYSKESEALGGASDRASRLQESRDFQISQQQRNIDEYIAKTKTQIEMQNELRDDEYKRSLVSSGVNVLASGAAEYGKGLAEAQKVAEAADAAEVVKTQELNYAKALEGISGGTGIIDDVSDLSQESLGANYIPAVKAMLKEQGQDTDNMSDTLIGVYGEATKESPSSQVIAEMLPNIKDPSEYQKGYNLYEDALKREGSADKVAEGKAKEKTKYSETLKKSQGVKSRIETLIGAGTSGDASGSYSKIKETLNKDTLSETELEVAMEDMKELVYTNLEKKSDSDIVKEAKNLGIIINTGDTPETIKMNLLKYYTSELLKAYPPELITTDETDIINMLGAE